MKQKKILILYIFLMSVSGAFCQKGFQNLKDYDYAPYHFGFLLGYNHMGFSMKTDVSQINTRVFLPIEFSGSANQTAILKSAEPISSGGFTIGIIGNLRITDHFDLRFIPALSFGERDIVYNYIISPTLTNKDTVFLAKSAKSTLLELPLMIKYKGDRINNARPYILGGIKYAIDLTSDAKKNTENQTSKELPLKLKQSDLYGEFGAGFDFYFDWFKMGIEAKMSYGINNILIRDDSMYTSAISRLHSKIFQISVTFE